MPLDERSDVRDWARPGWHCEVLPSGARNFVWNPGLVVDLDLLRWQLRGPLAVQREPAPEKVVHRRITEEDEHVRRYMYVFERMYSNTWSILQGSHVSYDPVRVPYLWVFSSRSSAPGRRPALEVHESLVMY
jgi:hypothetical protein